ncbi:MAG: prepilin peptidase [Candidatus Portiera sp.]|nr:prepilin peptidase [Portiera sp.]
MENLLIIYPELLKEGWFLYLNLVWGGLIAGSFCTMLIYRLPLIIERDYNQNPDAKTNHHHENLSLAFPSSHCPECGKGIPVYLNLPLLGYLLARGKCSKCAAKIAWYYPVTEMLCVFSALLAGWLLGASPNLLPLLLLFWALITLSIIDWRSGLLPDQLTLGIIWTGLLFNSLMPSSIPYASLPQAIIGVVAVYVFLSLMNALYYIIRRRIGIGGGDIKLFAGLAAYFGWQGLLPLLFFASISGLMFFILVVLSKVVFIKATISSKESSSSNALLSEQKWGPHIALAAIIYLLLFHLSPDLLGLFVPVNNYR